MEHQRFEGKATKTTELANGDLLIEGWAAKWDGVDRQNENFAPGAFKRAITRFLHGNNPLCFHHKADKVIGEVLHLEEKREGLWMRARVDHQPESSPYRWIYNAIKKGSLKGLSVGGFFRRIADKIVDVDLTEVSVTGVPVMPSTGFSVVAGKAMSGTMNDVEDRLLRLQVADLDRRANMVALKLRQEILSRR